MRCRNAVQYPTHTALDISGTSFRYRPKGRSPTLRQEGDLTGSFAYACQTLQNGLVACRNGLNCKAAPAFSDRQQGDRSQAESRCRSRTMLRPPGSTPTVTAATAFDSVPRSVIYRSHSATHVIGTKGPLPHIFCCKSADHIQNRIFTRPSMLPD